jgi:hypothetical protein
VAGDFISVIKIVSARVPLEEIMDRRFIELTELASVHPPNATEIPDQPTSTDRMYHAALARFTGFVSPGSIALAWMDWWLHLSASPGKQQLLIQKATRKASRLHRATRTGSPLPCAAVAALAVLPDLPELLDAAAVVA